MKLHFFLELEFEEEVSPAPTNVAFCDTQRRTLALDAKG